VAAPFKAEQLINKIEVEYDVNQNPIYYGVAASGSATSAPVWRIAFIAYDLNGNPIEVTFADGTVEYNHVWDLRSTYSYS